MPIENSHGDFGYFEFVRGEFGFLDLVDFGGVVISEESVIWFKGFCYDE